MALQVNNITTDLVAQTLGVNSHDVGTLCISDNINKWSKYKPVRLNVVSTIGNANWWKGDDGNCGFEMPAQTYAEESSVKGWNYLKPTSDYYYRLDDFVGYEHTGHNPPIMKIDSENIIFDFAVDDVLNLSMDINYNNGTVNPERWIRMEDLRGSSLGSMFPAIVIAGMDINNVSQTPIIFSGEKRIMDYSSVDSKLRVTIEGTPNLEKLRTFLWGNSSKIYYTFVSIGLLNGNKWTETTARKLLPPAPILPSNLRIISGRFSIKIEYYYIGRRTEIDDTNISPIYKGDAINRMHNDCTFWLNEVMNHAGTGYFNPSDFIVEYINVRGETIRHTLLGYIYRNGFSSSMGDREFLIAENAGTNELNIKINMESYGDNPPVVDSYIKFFYKTIKGTEVEVGGTGWIKIQDV